MSSSEVDHYIEKAPEYAKPILEKIREAFHAAGPDIQETIKWNVPHFEHKGVLGLMAAFKTYVRWGFWKEKLMTDPAGSMNNKITGVSELPPKKKMVASVREAIRLNEEGVKAPRPNARKKSPLKMPADLAAALKKNKKAQAAFNAFPPSHKREYLEWILDAKREETRKKRIASAIEWIAEGKSRNWKYQRSSRA